MTLKATQVGKRWALAAALSGGVAIVLTAGGIAGATTSKVGPNQIFHGTVNGSLGAYSPAVIQMACFGAVRPGQTGHPFKGQTLGLVRELDPIKGNGNTGAAATRVIARFVVGAAAPVGHIVLTSYGAAVGIPTSLSLPCGGAGTVVFSPDPSAGNPRASTVAVEFVGQP